VPLRCDASGFNGTLYASVPLPEPLAPLVIVTHVVLFVDVHEHPAAAVIETDPVAPPNGTVRDVGEIENEHVFPA